MILKNSLIKVFIINITSLLLIQGKGNDTVSHEKDDLMQNLNKEATWSVLFEEEYFNMTMTQKRTMKITITHLDPAWGPEFEFHILPQDKEVLSLADNIIKFKDIEHGQTSWSGNFTVEALFIGHSEIFVELHRPNATIEMAMANAKVLILRHVSKLDMVFQSIVGIFVILLYINFGAVLQLDDLKAILIKPIGPAIGFIGQFLIMPILSFLIGYILFRDMIELRLGLFFTGCTPGGGASNIFTVILNGNINLSITMTTISNLAAFGMMPIWIFTLGAIIFHEGNLALPFKTITIMSFSLVVPLIIGIALQKCSPSVGKTMAKFLKPVSVCFIVFIVVFGFTVNSFMFRLFSWKIICAGSALPWIGYIIGWIMAVLCRQSSRDALTIAIETGIQNAGIAIFMLNVSLPQPQADMTSAVPIASSMMTPLPLLLLYILKKSLCRTSIEETEEPGIKENKFTETKAIVERRELEEMKNREVAIKT